MTLNKRGDIRGDGRSRSDADRRPDKRGPIPVHSLFTPMMPRHEPATHEFTVGKKGD